MAGLFDTIEFAPLLPIWALILAALALTAPLFLRPKTAIRGRYFRIAFACLLILTLARPVAIQTEREEGENTALLLVDESGSQDLTGRLDATRKAADDLVNNTALPPNIKWQRVTHKNQEDEGEGDQGTALFSTLTDALSTMSTAQLAGVVILSDGIIHDENLRGALAKQDAPIHSIITGDPDLQDRRLIIEQAPQFGLVGKSVDVQLRIDDGDRNRGEAVRLSYKLNNGPLVDVSVRVGRTETIRIRPEHRGQNIVQFQVDPLDNEVSLANNQAVLSVSGVRDRLRVVLISGEPYQGERAWRTTLKSDPAVDLVHFTILRLPSSQDFTPVQELSLIPFPSRQLFEDKLYEFDLVIFDRYTLRGVLQSRYLANLTSYVNSGGAVLVSVGPEYAQALSLANTPLAHILPAQPTGYIIDESFRPELTDIGNRHPVTAALPRLWGQDRSWGKWERMVDAQLLGGKTLLSGPANRPLLTLNQVGEGRVALLLSDQSWLWGKNIDGGGPQTELVRRLAHWLMKEPDLEEEALRASAQGKDITITRQSLDEGQTSVQLTGPKGNTRSIALTPTREGQSEATVSVEDHGLYRLSDGALQSFVATGALNSLEYRELRSKSDSLGPLSEATGGGLYWLEDGLPAIRVVDTDDTKAGRRWMGLQSNNAGRVLRIIQIELIPAWLALLLLLSLLAFTWYRESR